MQRQTRQWTTRLAIAAGLVLGLWLLSTMRTPSPAPPPVQRIQAEPTRAVPMPAAPALRPAPKSPSAAPILEPAPEEDAAVEPKDTAEPEGTTVTVFLTAEDYDGGLVEDAQMGLMGCAMLDYTPTEDGIEAQVERGGRCTARGMRMDGLLRIRAEPVEFFADEDMDVVLIFPAERTGGIGVQFQPTDDGFFLVVAVMPGTPAYIAGLSPGDRILSVGGVDTAELDADGFVAEMTGPEGTDVEFELAYEGDTGLSIETVTLTRAFLSG